MVLILFCLSFSLVLGSLIVILGSSPIYSLLALISCFFCLSGLLLLIGGDFFACCYLIIYIGAIAVLFLFVVMLLNIRSVEWQFSNARFIPLSSFFLGLGILQILGGLIFFDFDFKNWFGTFYFYLVCFDFFFLLVYGLNFLYLWSFIELTYFLFFLSLIYFLVWYPFIVSCTDAVEFKFFKRVCIPVIPYNLPYCHFIILFFTLYFYSFIYVNPLRSNYYLVSSTYAELMFLNNWLDFSHVIFLGSILYSYFGFFIILAGIILLIAMLGSIYLTLSRVGDSFVQSIGSQMSRHSSVFIRAIVSKK